MSPPRTSAVVSNRASALGRIFHLAHVLAQVGPDVAQHTPYLDRVVTRIALSVPLSAYRSQRTALGSHAQKSSFRRLSVSRLSAPRSLAQVVRKPSGGEPGDFFKFSRLLKEVGRPGHDFEPLLRPYLLSRLAVQADHGLVFPADDEQRRRYHTGQRLPRQIRASAARDDCAHRIRAFCRRDQRGPCPRAGAEVADPEGLRVRLLCQPVGGARQPVGEQPDVEPKVSRPEIYLLLFGCEKVDKQGSKARFA